MKDGAWETKRARKGVCDIEKGNAIAKKKSDNEREIRLKSERLKSFGPICVIPLTNHTLIARIVQTNKLIGQNDFRTLVGNHFRYHC